MTTYVWTDLRNHAIDSFNGETPGAELEQRILTVFTHHPQIVAAGIDYIAAQHAGGTIRSPWAVLAVHVEKATTPSDVTATDSRDRDKAIRNAEQWIRATGLHIDRQTELLDALYDIGGFGDKGQTLAPWAADENLRQRMVALWQEARPAAEQLDAELDDRLDRWRDQHTQAAA